MANRTKHAQRSRRGRDRSGMYRKYVIGNMPLYAGPNFNLVHRLTDAFRQHIG
jgi:hypothetical protein